LGISAMGSRLGLGLACCGRIRLCSGKLLRLMLALGWMGLGERLLSALLRISLLLVSHKLRPFLRAA
jgi:hypothetical protein